ncbi:MAG: YqgE/AlgH family protein [Rickettsiales bacterium]|nr:YqgE/AlgH family protein [Rickettsiales bacterium]
MSRSLLSKAASMLFTRDKSPTSNIVLGSAPSSAAVSSSNIHILDGSKALEGGYLAGQLLVATPVIDNGCFQRAVVYVFSHSAEGAMGVIINQPIERVHFSSLIEGLKLPNDAQNQEIPVYFGGPVERNRGFIIHSAPPQPESVSATPVGEVAVTASSTILNDILLGKGPAQAALVVGYTGWAPGQLEQEIEQNSWIAAPATAKLVFDTEDDLKWGMASKSLGVDMAFFSTTVGHA